MKKYKDDYEIITTKDEKGRESQRVVYKGTYFELTASETQIAAFKKKHILMLIIIFALRISAGFLENKGMFQFYISFPYVFSFLALWYMASGTFRLSAKKRKYRRDEADRSIKHLKTGSYYLMVLLAIETIGELFWIFLFSPSANSFQESIYLLLTILTINILFFLIRLQREIIVSPSA